MPGADARSVATTLLRAWTSGDFATTRSLIHDDVTFVGPLGVTEGADDYMRGLQGFARMVKGAEQRQVIAEGDDVCIIYDLITDTPAGAIPTAGWYRVRDGRVSSLRVFFDARPFERGPAPAGDGEDGKDDGTDTPG
jgi:ketosteroid isomerase-like protein